MVATGFSIRDAGWTWKVGWGVGQGQAGVKASRLEGLPGSVLQGSPAWMALSSITGMPA